MSWEVPENISHAVLNAEVSIRLPALSRCSTNSCVTSSVVRTASICQWPGDPYLDERAGSSLGGLGLLLYALFSWSRFDQVGSKAVALFQQLRVGLHLAFLDARISCKCAIFPPRVPVSLVAMIRAIDRGRVLSGTNQAG